ncbi:MAG TPA: hypothetical protein PKA64_13750 [Myxococcota bacterium]|nr:hypothetical protein [Myxococcota bacterium]
MGLFRNNYDADVLRAIAYARLQIASGRGLESIAHALATSELGLVSRSMSKALEAMQRGEDVRGVLQDQIAHAPAKSYGDLLTALMAEGQAAIHRMDELSEEIQGLRKVKVENYAKLLDGRLKFATILFLCTFVPCFLEVCEEVPENDIVPQIELSSTFYTTFFLIASTAVAGLVVSMKYTD